MSDRRHYTIPRSRNEGPLTKRELEALAMLARGLTLEAAAEVMGISVQTIKNHTSYAYHKLGVGGHVEAFCKLGWLVVP